MTLAELRALVRLTLSSVAAWPDATLDTWIQGANRLYSAHFPRRYRATISLTTGTQAYAVPGASSVSGLISVEYPAGQTPSRFLRCVAEWSDDFAAGRSFTTGEACYAVRGVGVSGGDGGDDTTAVGCANCVGEIVFAETVATGESAIVEYWGPHPAPAVGANTAVITVPDQHIEALSAYVDFAAHYELETDEALAADGTTIVLAQLGEESRRAWNRYKEVMDRLSWLGGPDVGTVQPNWGRYGL